jgi:hypothetical protein
MAPPVSFWGASLAAMLTGGCGCGAVRFELSGDALQSASYCHCTRCQRRTGTAASAQARFEAPALRVLSGEDVIRSWGPPGGWSKLFCGECGSALFARQPGGELMSVRLGALDQDPGIRPQWRQFVAYAAPWEPIPDDGLPRYDEGPP